MYDDVDKSTVTETLKQAKSLIQNERKWIKGASASNRKRAAGRPSLPFQSKHATCFCATGAVMRAAYDTYTARQNGYWWRDCDESLWILDEALYLIFPTGNTVETYNDRKRTTHADIMALFDRAIALAEANAKEGK